MADRTSWREPHEETSGSESDDEADDEEENENADNSKVSETTTLKTPLTPEVATPALENTGTVSKFDHPVFKIISKENGLVNKMDYEEVRERLSCLGLNKK